MEDWKLLQNMKNNTNYKYNRQNNYNNKNSFISFKPATENLIDDKNISNFDQSNNENDENNNNSAEYYHLQDCQEDEGCKCMEVICNAEMMQNDENEY